MVTQGVCIGYTARNTCPHGSYSYRFAEISRWLGEKALEGKGSIPESPTQTNACLSQFDLLLGRDIYNSS